MSKAQLEQEIELLESRLAKAKATKPAHDTIGAYQATLLEIEDELFENRQTLNNLNESSKLQSADKNQ
jgi:hypothetical protein